MSPRLILTLASLSALSCKDKSTAAGADTGAADDAWRPDVVCPGDDGCVDNAGQLYAGAAAVEITPTCFESWGDIDENGEYDDDTEPFFDCGCDRLCEGDDGWPGADEGEGDGEFHAIWLAGFGNGRPAAGVHDPLWARTIVMQSGDTTVAIMALDLVGWFYNDVQTMREGLADAGIDLLLVQSTHQHEGPDTLGQWGERVGKRGVDEDYRAFVIAQGIASAQQAMAALEPATMYAGAIDTAAPWGDKGTRNSVRDSRDPVVIDEMLYTARFAAENGDTIATLVNWGNHPEVLSDENTLITSDYSHYLREAVEDGVQWADSSTDGVGGVAIYVNAAVGGLMTPLGITVTDGDGVDHSASDWAKSEALGKIMGELALQSLQGATPVADPVVSALAAQVYIPMENFAFQAMFAIGAFDRQAYNYDPEADLDDDNIPELLTEMDFIRVGNVAMLSVPGELAPELAIGGYDGSHVNTTEVPLVDPENPNPPDLSAAPDGPYLKDMMGGEYNWIVGLGNDEVGYLLPPYDYKLHDTTPYLQEAEGDHYEETNSLGPQAVPVLLELAETLTSW